MAQKKNAGGADQMMYVVITVLGAWAIWEWIINPWLQTHQQQQAPPLSSGCYDSFGNVVACAAPTATIPIAVQQPQPQPSPPAPTPTLNNYLTTQLIAQQRATTPTALAARQAALANQQALQPARRTGVQGIVPSWPSGGGPAFNAFIPGGGMTFGGANAFGSPAHGVMESLPKNSWVQ